MRYLLLLCFYRRNHYRFRYQVLSYLGDITLIVHVLSLGFLTVNVPVVPIQFVVIFFSSVWIRVSRSNTIPRMLEFSSSWSEIVFFRPAITLQTIQDSIYVSLSWKVSLRTSLILLIRSLRRIVVHVSTISSTYLVV